MAYGDKESNTALFWVSLCFQAEPSRRTHLIDPIHEVHGDAEGQGMMVRVPKKGGEDFHPRGPGLPIPILLCSLNTSLAVNGIFPKFCPVMQYLR